MILDWVPAHFPTDAHGLAHFDGTPLYEHADPREGFHQDWNTLIYNFGRREVQWLPDRQRAALAGAFPRRWAARRCGRLDALSRLQPRRRANGCPTSTAAARIWKSIDFLRDLNAVVARALPRRHDDRRGIHRLAGRHAPVAGRRAGLPLQVEHGLDARHAALHGAGSGPPRLCTTTR